MTEQEPLLNCPFCDGEAERFLNPMYGDYSMVRCRCCGASAFDKKWNKRVSNDRTRT